MTEAESNSSILYWRDKFSEAQSKYADDIQNIDLWWRQYIGKRDDDVTEVDQSIKRTRRYRTNPLLRNFSFELIESQIDSSIPMPKVTSPTRDKHKMRNARIIEAMLKAELKKLDLSRMNDIEERVVKACGGAFKTIYWDNSKGRNGDIGIDFLAPNQVIPQPGITNIEDMDYIFTTHEETKNSLAMRYGVDIDESESTDIGALTTLSTEQRNENREETITQVTAYFKNDDGRLGVFSWAGNTILIDDEDYNARSDYVCAQCGLPKPFDGSDCECGSDKFIRRNLDSEELTEDYILEAGDEATGVPDIVIPAMSMQKGEKISGKKDIDKALQGGTVGNIGIDGSTYTYAPTKIPYYIPSVFPVMIRRNVSIYGRFLGDSDCDKIRDMQINHNNLALKLQEKIFKGGSILTLPDNVCIQTDDRELKVVRVTSPNQISMIQSINLQPNIQNDIAMLNKYYEDARSTLGITESYQGKPDSTADSGTAKLAQINQSQGRLESKSQMKWASYKDLFKAIFQYMLAYSDKPIDFIAQDEDGSQTTYTFDRHAFLYQTTGGSWEYDDDYIFDVDSAGGLTQNRQQMWSEIRQNFQSGTYGSPQDTQTLIMFWSQMEDADYPNAGAIKTHLRNEYEKQQAAIQAQMQQQQAQQQSAAEQQQAEQGGQSLQGQQQGQKQQMKTADILSRVGDFLKQ